MLAQARLLLKKIGARLLNSIHDDAMPAVIHRMVDGTFLSVWPEVEKVSAVCVCLCVHVCERGRGSV